MPATAHATLGASGAHRWLECPGQPALSVGIARTTNEYAEEGTAAHHVGEWCLTDGSNAKSKIGKTIMKSALTGEWIVCTKDMAEAVQVYLDYVRESKAALPGATMVIEHKFNLDWLMSGMFGTNDCNIFQPYGKMKVIDYKHGRGVQVDALDNDQLMYYGLGALGAENLQCIEEIELVIVQPRAPGDNPIRSWTITPEQLYAWAQTRLLPGAKRTLEKDAKLIAGDWCQFCPAMAVCPALRQRNFEAAGLAFSPIEIPEPKTLTLAAPATLTTERLEQVLQLADLMSDWATAVASELKLRLEGGENGTLYKIVAGRSSRKWIDEAEAAKVLAAHIDPWEKSLVSPKGADDMMKDLNVKKADREAIVAALVEKTCGRSLAPMADKRLALTITNPFTVIETTAEVLE